MAGCPKILFMDCTPEDLAWDRRSSFGRQMARRRWYGLERVVKYGYPDSETRSSLMREIGAFSPRKGRPRTVVHRNDPRCRCVECRKSRFESPYDRLLRSAIAYIQF